MADAIGSVTESIRAAVDAQHAVIAAAKAAAQAAHAAKTQPSAETPPTGGGS